MAKRIGFIDPLTGEALHRVDAALVTSSGRIVAPIDAEVARFVESSDYAESFGWQWNRWDSTLSDRRNTGSAKLQIVLERTHFHKYDLSDKTVLECGMGGGDDTEVLLRLPFAEVHSFDLSRGVDRAARYLRDDRLIISQASIFEIPYADKSFDVVYCHRVLQHTPSPERALRSICRKVRPGGLLFAHSYKRSVRYMMHYKYKYRPVTRRMRAESVSALLERYGTQLHALNSRLIGSGRRSARALAYGFVPFEWIPNYGELGVAELLELEKLVTFDALTPRYDRPMTWRRFASILVDEGFVIEHFSNPPTSPLYATARKRDDGTGAFIGRVAGRDARLPGGPM